MNALYWWLTLAVLLFCIGAFGVLVRRNVIVVVMCLELMLNAANLNFVAFWRYGPSPAPATGVVFVAFSVAVAAAEAAVGLALVISIYRRQKSIRLQEAVRLKG